ncbi:MAG: hypothetical protein ACI4RA_09735 [Kiritimatiellia bacterium]
MSLRTVVSLAAACWALAGWTAPGVSKAAYLDLVEAAVGAYTPEHMRAYHARVKKEGIREHGFPRLAANLGTLVANGRRMGDAGLVREMMTTCCGQMATALEVAQRRNAGRYVGVGNDFTVKEIVLCLLALEKARVFPREVTEGWRADIRRVVPETAYNCQPRPGDPVAHNWAVFGAASEQLRAFAGLGGSAAYTERHFSDQLRFFDANGMYKDPHQPMVYDLVTRLQFMLAMAYGYSGPSRAALEANLLKSAEPTLLMQSVTGEIPYGGRSNQFLHCETFYAAVCEWYAGWFKAKGDLKTAARFRRAAKRAVESLAYWLDQPNYRHIKNRFPLETRQGCEGYGYFDKYMVTMGSWACLGALFADESIPAADESPVATVFRMSDDFHRICLQAGDYGAEIDTACDAPYDANGVGRVQRRGAPPMLAISVPFPCGAARRPNYETGFTNATPLAILPGWKAEGAWAYAYDGPYAVREARVVEDRARVELACPRAGRPALRWEIDLSADGLAMTVTGAHGEELALTLPAFAFDGETHTEIHAATDALDVTFGGWTSHATTSGEMVDMGRMYGNRNGFSRRYEARGRSPLCVTMRLHRAVRAK